MSESYICGPAISRSCRPSPAWGAAASDLMTMSRVARFVLVRALVLHGIIGADPEAQQRARRHRDGSLPAIARWALPALLYPRPNHPSAHETRRLAPVRALARPLQSVDSALPAAMVW